MPGPRFVLLAARLPYYDGVMRARIAALAAEENPPPPQPTSTPFARGPSNVYTPEVVTPLSVVTDPILGSLISFGTG